MPVPDNVIGRRRTRQPGASPAGALDQAFDLSGLGHVRHLAAAYGRRLRLTDRQVAHLLIIVGELTANAVAHGGGHGWLRVWRQGGRLHCEVSDEGRGMSDPQAGAAAPDPEAASGRGIWMCRQLCADLVIGCRQGGGATVTAVLDLGRPLPHQQPLRSSSRLVPARSGSKSPVPGSNGSGR